MKLFTVCFLFLTTNAFGQDCKTLDNFTSFHGINFGKRFPDSLRKYCDIDYNEVRADSAFFIWEDKIKYGNKFSEWVNVRFSFSYMAFHAIKDGRIYLILLQRPLKEDDSISLSKKEYPFFFEGVTDELSSIFGQMTNEELKEDVFTKEIVRTWECEKMKIEFSLSFAAFRNYTLSFINKELDKQRKILKYTK